jgi:phospholipid N-methyltransferase
VIEILDEFVNDLKKINDTRLKVIKGDVIQKSSDLSKESVDVILSSIPLSRLEEDQRIKLIEVSAKALKSGGQMIIYYQTSKLSLPILENTFKEVEWHFDPRNFIPYFILIAKK